jgi:hypothetical protein
MSLPMTDAREGSPRSARGRPAWRVTLSGACVGVCWLASAALGAQPPEIVIRPAPQRVKPLTEQEKKRIHDAIDRGIAYLKRTQMPTGSWIIGKEGHLLPLNYPAGLAGLGGLALLESGVPTNDPAVTAASRFIRQSGPRLFRTYDLALAIFFLDRLEDVHDRPLIRSLALRLAAGQTAWGGWSYNCPLLSSKQEKKLEQALSKKTRADLPHWRHPPPPPPRGMHGMSSDGADNSNTQFAVLALGVARRHGLSLDYSLALVEQRFRLSESTTGWDYQWVSRVPHGYGSMTCAGLLGLAVGRAVAEEKPDLKSKKGLAQAEDPSIAWGLKVLGAYLQDPSDFRGVAALGAFGPRGTVNLYFLWSVERVGVLCGVDTIGGIDWYRWGTELLLRSQRPDGSWLGRGSYGYPVVDTSFALLFLRRSDLLPDLRKELKKRVKIVDPGPFILPKKAGKGKGPALPDLKGLTLAAEEPLTVDLGAVPVGKPAQRPFRVRGPADFRITAIRGGDERLKVQADSLPAKVHNLTVTVQLDKAGPLERTLYLHTDLPGQAEVAVRLRLRATPASRSPKQ